MNQAMTLIDALGGADNIVDVQPCSLRIRVEVAYQDEVSEKALRIPGVLAIVRSGKVVQIVAGSASDAIAENMMSALQRRGRTLE